MADNTIIGHVSLIGNNLFQLNMAYISPPNDNPIFYGAPAALLDSREDPINTSFSIKPE